MVNSISPLRRLRQESHKFKTSLGYIVRCCLKILKVGKISKTELLQVLDIIPFSEGR
jgi:hypothetical protein